MAHTRYLATPHSLSSSTYPLFFTCLRPGMCFRWSLAQSESKKPFRQYFFRGVEAEKMIDLTEKEFIGMVHSRARRCFKRNSINEHLRNAIILPEMLGAQIGVYNGLGYHLVEIKPQMMGHYLGEFSLTYTPVRHGGKAASSTAVQKFIDLK